MHNCQL